MIFYDGVCGLCNRSVRFVSRIDRESLFHYSQLQGKLAEELELNPQSPSVVLIEEMGGDHERLTTGSTAALRILNVIGGGWRLVSWLRIVPRPIRDGIYGWIAARRYRWFGKFDSCQLPSPELRERFLD